MTSKVNQRAKRKNEFSDKKIEPNMKALKKEDIIARFSALQANYKILEKKNMKLEEENNVQKESIILLEETVKVLEEKANMNNIEKKIYRNSNRYFKSRRCKHTIIFVWRL